MERDGDLFQDIEFERTEERLGQVGAWDNVWMGYNDEYNDESAAAVGRHAHEHIVSDEPPVGHNDANVCTVENLFQDQHWQHYANENGYFVGLVEGRNAPGIELPPEGSSPIDFDAAGEAMERIDFEPSDVQDRHRIAPSQTGKEGSLGGRLGHHTATPPKTMASSTLETDSAATEETTPPNTSSTLSPQFSLRTDKESYVCDHPECARNDRVYGKWSALLHHQRKHIPEEKRAYPCPHCSRRFLYPKDVVRHLRSHVEPSFQCPDCSRKFSRFDNLTRHQKKACSRSEPPTPQRTTRARARSASFLPKPIRPRLMATHTEMSNASSTRRPLQSPSGPPVRGVLSDDQSQVEDGLIDPELTGYQMPPTGPQQP